MKKILKLIPESYRKRGLAVVCFVPLRAVVDLMGVAVLFPMLFVVLDGGDAFNNSFLSKVSEYLGFSDNHSFILFLVISILVVILLKSIINLVLVNFQNKYLLSLFKHFSTKLFSLLYGKGLLYVKNSNSAELTFNINAVCYNFVVGYLSSILKASGELMFCLFLLIALCLYNPLSALFVILAFVPMVVVYLRVVRSRLKEYGTEEMKARREQQKIVQETFKGYAEMEVNKAFPLMREKFSKGLFRISKYRVKSLLIQSIPTYMLEMAVAVVLSIMVLSSLDANDASMRVFLGVFAMAMIRMMPSVHSVISSWGSIKSTEYTRSIIEEFDSSSAPEPVRPARTDAPPSIISFEHSIDVKNLSFSYSTGQVINGLSFQINKGERFGIKGRTGAGKSTLFNLLLGFFSPDAGSIAIDGVPLSANNRESWHSMVGYVPQDVFIADLSLAENIALGYDLEKIDMDKVWTVLEQVSLKDFAESLPDGANTIVGEGGCRISGGQRQRIGIARALYKNAQVLFFDEATSSLDTETEREVNKSIEELSDTHSQLTMLIISHRSSSLELCDRILEI